MRVGIILAQDFTLSAFSLFLDHIRLAADDGDGSRPVRASWTILAESGRPVRSSCGVSVSATAGFGDPAAFDYVVVVGGLLRSEDPIDATASAFIVRAAAAGTTLVGLCTGVFILCRLGLMRDRRCCVSWYHHQDFLAEFPDHDAVADRLFMIDGKRISCAGGAGTADLAAALISRHLGASAAQKSRQLMMFDRSRSGNESQPHPPVEQDQAKGKLARALLLMEQNIAEPLSIDRLAEELSLSTRQLERLSQDAFGKRPSDIYRTIRLRYASWLLVTSEQSITAIAQDAGFSDCAHFSRLFRVAFGRSPSQARRGPAMVCDAGVAGARLFVAETSVPNVAPQCIA